MAQPEPVDDLELELRFTGEESFGKYLDLYESHEAFVNLPGVSRCVCVCTPALDATAPHERRASGWTTWHT